MKKLIFLLLPLLLSCSSKEIYQTKIVQNETSIDSLYLSESITERKFISFSTNNAIQLDVDSTFIGVINTRDGKASYLTILRPNRVVNIIINKDSSIVTDQVSDSLLNYLWKSQNDFMAKNGHFIFTSDNTDSLLSLYTSFGKERNDIIELHSNQLTPEDKELLIYQNKARLNSFLFHYGKFIKNIPLNNEYYDFIDQIDNNHSYAKTLPNNLLYKHEINYLRRNDKLNGITSFISYIESQTSNIDLSNYLKATYLRKIIEDPSRWKLHQPLLSSENLKTAIQQERGNSYYHLIQNSAGSYFASQKGERAFNFTAERLDGSILKLSDLEGKLVFIDNWATWCGPCIEHRPFVLDMVERYKDNSQIEILMISVNESKEDWIRYLKKKNELHQKNNLIIENGMRTDYGDKFNIKSIPKYILIDESGHIINSDLPNPSNRLIELIDDKLEEM